MSPVMERRVLRGLGFGLGTSWIHLWTGIERKLREIHVKVLDHVYMKYLYTCHGMIHRFEYHIPGRTTLTLPLEVAAVPGLG